MKFLNDKSATHRKNVMDCHGDLIFTKNEYCLEFDQGWTDENTGWTFQNITIQGVRGKNKVLRFISAAKVLWEFV